ncbi:hypothetical protein HG535_0C04720 [Zygotorulaspora mrakii]|uniref:Cullin family profile domain-containing protein n=1 Tax=Zygotorulaspora mrakii TaxID=42260 RepID=A0A7H9B0G3_ZYGMR|nr:uncharacterized protein HG535_0C04720 [Zygotorulaspora mrakii]QLG72118.1 hypothetical protein HG535_0C04720 [Zygotorulaspora mrakii]
MQNLKVIEKRVNSHVAKCTFKILTDNIRSMKVTVSDATELHTFISSSLERYFKDDSSFWGNDWFDLEDSAGSEQSHKKLQQDAIYCLKALCQAKIWRNADEKLRLSHTRRRISYIYNQREVVATIWKELKKRCESLISLKFDLYVSSIESNLSHGSKLVEYWSNLYQNYKNFLSTFLPFLEYIRVNYTSLVHDIPTDMNLLDIYELYFITLVKTKLNSKFISFLKSYVFECFNRETSKLNVSRVESPMLLVYKHRASIFDDTELLFEDFYFGLIREYVQTHVDIKINLTYLNHVIRYLKNNALITGAISMALLDRSNTIFLENTILLHSQCVTLLGVLKDDIPLEFGTNKSEKFNQISDQLVVLIGTYKTRGVATSFQNIYSELIHHSLKAMIAKKADLHSQFVEICKLVLITDNEKSLQCHARIEITKAMGGSLNLMSSYSKLCDSSIRKFNKSVINNLVKTSNLEPKNSLIINVPILLKLDSSFLIRYSHSLFRRAIFFGPKIYETLTNSRYLEFHLLILFEKHYKNSPSYQGLMLLKLEILRSAKLALDFQSHYKDNTEINFFLFNRNHIPSTFRGEGSEVGTLPEHLQEVWKNFEEFYLEKDPKAEHKVISPIYKFQFCEVETPYFLSNGKRLTLDLTIFQASVISLFNDADLLTYEHILEKTKLDSAALKEILLLFNDIGLLKLHKGSYLLNNAFQPDESRIKDGKLRFLVNNNVNTGLGRNETNIIDSHHREGNRSYWTQELLKACIVRSLKGRKDGLEYEVLFEEVESRFLGMSVGEFKEALEKTIREKYITKRENYYIY